MAKCNVCFRGCEIGEGKTGFCGARKCENGIIKADNYGMLTALALDPIEKKPLSMYYPGSAFVSVGSYGCNLRCPFCQNSDISWSDYALSCREQTNYLAPEELVEIALNHRHKGNIGIAFTYNEPLIGYEYVRDTAKLAHEAGLKKVLVTNGTASLEVLAELKPYINAMNIDLKGFTDRYYSDVLKGSRGMVMDFITESAKFCHVELTTLIVPGENDSEDEMRKLSAWVAGLNNLYDGRTGRDIPLHITRFFPRFHMQDRPPTDVKVIYRLAHIAREELRYVYTGNC